MIDKHSKTMFEEYYDARRSKENSDFVNFCLVVLLVLVGGGMIFGIYNSNRWKNSYHKAVNASQDIKEENIELKSKNESLLVLVNKIESFEKERNKAEYKAEVLVREVEQLKARNRSLVKEVNNKEKKVNELEKAIQVNNLLFYPHPKRIYTSYRVNSSPKSGQAASMAVKDQLKENKSKTIKLDQLGNDMSKNLLGIFALVSLLVYLVKTRFHRL
jgi:chromosome segregation ATPase